MQLKKLGFQILPMAVLWGAISTLCAEPNFSGQWKMNGAKSSFAPLPQPDSLLRRITQVGSHLKIRTTQVGQQREIVTDLAYTTDGAECKNVIRGQVFTGSARWDGDTLLIESRREVQGMKIVQKESWTLSGDGRTLSISNHIDTGHGLDLTIVLEKQ